MRKLKNRKGFTLVEMLIVVAIIAILIAISIPLVNNALEKARHATDDANFRAAAGLGTIGYLANSEYFSAEKTYTYYINKASQGVLVDGDNKGVDGNVVTLTGYEKYKSRCSEAKGTDGNGSTGTYTNAMIQVKVATDGKVTVTWETYA